MCSRFSSTPLAERRGSPKAVGLTRLCSSTSSGLVPSSATWTTLPVAPRDPSWRKARAGSRTSRIPLSSISKIPISSVEPKRFFWLRRMRKL